jgi:fructokinase
VITVAGEALMDVLVDPLGSATALPGGAPFNVARAIARLGGDSCFLGRLSGDGFGQRLRKLLEEQHVRIAVPAPVPAPTTLAIAELDGAGAADYRFYLHGTSAGHLRPGDISTEITRSSAAITLGGLGIVMEPTASALLWLLHQAAPETTVLLDPNCRPRAVHDPARYRARLTGFLARADVVKVSADDLQFLSPQTDPRLTARSLLGHGPAAVLVTDGPAPITAHTAEAERFIPVPQAGIVDTVGAGDAFVAGFLTWWSGCQLSREDLSDTDRLTQACAAAAEVAAAACTVRGADLPPGFHWSQAPFPT